MRLCRNERVYYQVERKYQKLKMNTEIAQTKICKKCGRILPVEEFSLERGQFHNPYYRGECKKCEYKRHRKYLEEKNKNGALRYSLKKNVFFDGKWIYKRVPLYAARAVVEEFIVNPDKENNIYIWHSGYDKEDYYYKNLYPLNQEQYRMIKNYFRKTGDDSEELIVKVMNEIKHKPDNWSKKAMNLVMCGIGYRGSENVDCREESYIKWHDMMNRCYNEKFHERQPQYKGCTVCEEWQNYSN